MNGDDRKVLCDISNSAFGVVTKLLARDQELARQLLSSKTSSRQIYREECLTIEMAVTLREMYPENVQITLFTPHEEKRNGADWYWRIVKGARAVHARVQAKRVHRTEFGQSDDVGQINIDNTQLDQLIKMTTENAKLPGLQNLEAWLVTYTRSNAVPICGESDLQQCTHHKHQSTCMKELPSLWIAPAKEIQRVLNGMNRVPVRTIIQHSLRLDCLLPCIGGLEEDADPGPANKGFTIHGDHRTFQDCIATIEGDTDLREEFEGALQFYV